MPKRSGDHMAKRREQLLDAAHACMIEHGLNDSSMAMIAQAAGLSIGAVYVHFKGKDEILTALLERSSARVMAMIEFTSLGALRERMAEMIRQQAGQGSLHARVNLELALAARREPALAGLIGRQAQQQRAALRRGLARLRDRGDLARTVDLDLVTDTLGCILLAGVHEASLGLPFDVETRIRMIDRELQGLRPDRSEDVRGRLAFSRLTAHEAGPRLSRLAEALRALREANGWTLSDIAGRTGLSVSTLSKVQNDQMSLTYDKLDSLSKGLGVDVTYFFTPFADAAVAQVSAPQATARRSVNRRGDGARVSTGIYEHRYPAAELSHKRMVPIFAELKARTLAEFGALLGHPGEEFTTVLEGRLEFHTEHYAPVTLEPGESIYFDSTMAHGYLAASDGPCRVLSVCTSSEAELERMMVERARRIDAG